MNFIIYVGCERPVTFSKHWSTIMAKQIKQEKTMEEWGNMLFMC